MKRKVWTFTPHLGGVKILPPEQADVIKRINEHAEKNYTGKYSPGLI